MGLKKFITSIPLVKRFLAKREIKHNEKMTKEIKGLVKTIEEKSYTVKELIKAKDIASSIKIDHNHIEKVGVTAPVSFYSVSSQEGLEAIRLGCYGRETITRTHYVNLERTTKEFYRWFSNKHSIDITLKFHDEMLEKAIYLETNGGKRKELVEEMLLRDEEKIYLNSILYRLGLIDYLNLTLLLLEGKNEILKQQVYCTV